MVGGKKRTTDAKADREDEMGKKSDGQVAGFFTIIRGPLLGDRVLFYHQIEEVASTS
jgi:hypothetical protein